MSNKTKRLARSQRNYHDGWYMLTPAFDPQKMVKGKIGSEEFIVQGGVNGLMFVQVPSTMEPEQRERLGKALASQGVNAIVVTHDVKFARLTRLRPKEEDVIREQIKKALAQTDSPTAGDGPSPGPGSFVDGDGPSSARPSDAQDPPRGHAEHEVEEGSGSPHDDS
jgi:hypothetical protein